MSSHAPWMEKIGVGGLARSLREIRKDWILSQPLRRVPLGIRSDCRGLSKNSFVWNGLVSCIGEGETSTVTILRGRRVLCPQASRGRHNAVLSA